MRIFHPRPKPGRQKFIGVNFRGGVAEVDELHPERRLALEQHGFAIQDADGSVSIPGDWTGPLPTTVEPDADSEPLDEGKSLSELTVAELREIADFEDVDVPKGAKKGEIIAALTNANDGPELDEGGVIDGSSFVAAIDLPEVVVSLSSDEV